MRLDEIWVDPKTFSKRKIEGLLKRHFITNYTINDDGTVDVDGDVKFNSKKFAKIPVMFGKVTGDFDLSQNNMLTSLFGSPDEVGGHYDCSVCNKLTMLTSSPRIVKGNFWANDMRNLHHLSGVSEIIGGDFNCRSAGNLTSMRGLPKEIKGTLDLSFNSNIKDVLLTFSVKKLKRIVISNKKVETIVNKHLSSKERDMIECQEELIEAGYKDYAGLK